MTKPFSVLISVYAKESPTYFFQSLETVINQTVKPDEIVVVADGPLTKGLDQVIESFRALFPIKLVRLPQNVGLGSALAEGLLACSNEYVARVDSDDLCTQERFEIQIEELEKQHEISVVGGFLEEFIHVPGDTGVVKAVPLSSDRVRAYSRNRNPMNHPSVMFRKSHILEVGSFQHMPFFEDYYLWLRLLSRGYNLANIPKIFVNFRSGGGMLGRRHGMSYAVHEFQFLKTCLKEHLIGKRNFALMVLQRFPARIAPKAALKIIYKLLLRKS
ncbi:MAG: glycosyltransferase [Imperialibacter sp.]|uniref:glycosyltransferase n=1 Tax=Imperialibacter sp. TaxID=2038411 RepID=UPI0032F06294